MNNSNAGFTRRNFLLLSAGAVAGAALIRDFTSDASTGDYEQAQRNIWKQSNAEQTSRLSLNRELIRYATLAPSSHNTQCWNFLVQATGAISIQPDFSRRCPAVDPDDHHLFVSMGCAAENLTLAALANGLNAKPNSNPSESGAISLSLEATKSKISDLYSAIPLRQSTRTEYDSQPLSKQELTLLEKAGSGKGVRVLLITEKKAMENILEFVTHANSAQMSDPAFMAELKSWIRFNRTEAMSSGDGLYAGISGNPSLPTWLGKLAFELAFKPKSENDKYAKHVRSSAGIAVFVSEANDRSHWVETGRCFQRFALQATALGVRNALLNQPVEVAAFRPSFVKHLALGSQRPDLVVRFGRAKLTTRSLRRNLDNVIGTT